MNRLYTPKGGNDKRGRIKMQLSILSLESAKITSEDKT